MLRRHEADEVAGGDEVLTAMHADADVDAFSLSGLDFHSGLEQVANDFGIHPMTLSKWLR